VTEQAPNAVNVLPQVLVWLKLLALVPLIVIPVMFNVAEPLLVNVTVCAVAVAPTTMLGNVTAEMFRLTAGAGALDELDPLLPHPAIIAATIPQPATKRIRAANPRSFPCTSLHNDVDADRPINEE
jgi:hypothetical protein